MRSVDRSIHNMTLDNIMIIITIGPPGTKTLENYPVAAAYTLKRKIVLLTIILYHINNITFDIIINEYYTFISYRYIYYIIIIAIMMNTI